MKLRPYEVEAVEFLILHPKVLLADQQGLGKTVEVLAALNARVILNDKRILFAVSKGKIYDWLYEIERWCPTLEEPPTIINGQKHYRLKKWREANCVIVSRETLRQDIDDVPRLWDVIIVDEAHRVYRNKKTQAFKAFMKLKSDRLWMLTGTPMRAGIHNLWGYLHAINPSLWSSYWRFVNTFCYVEKTPYGHNILGSKSEESNENLKKILKHAMLRRTKEQVGDEMPPKVRSTLRIELDVKTQDVHEEFWDEMLILLASGDLIIAPTVLTKILRMRQLCVCPKLLSERLGYGVGIQNIVDNIEDQPDHHTAIFTSFRKAIPYLREYIQSRLPKVDIFEIHGGVKAKDVYDTVQEYKAKRGIILSTIKFAEGQNFETCSYGYMLGPEWTPDENEQAEDRLHRMTSESTVFIYYIKHLNTVEELVYSVVNGKYSNINEVLKDRAILRRPTKTS